MTIVAAIFLGFLLAGCAPYFHKQFGAATGWVLALYPAGIFVGCIYLLDTRGDPVLFDVPWVPALGIRISYFVDDLTVLMVQLISGIGALILVYAGGYLQGHTRLGTMYGLLLFFMTSMLGLVSANNLYLLFVFWELTSLSSYLLIGFDHERAASRDAAWQALFVTSGGGLVMLVGFVLLDNAAGTAELSQITAHGAWLKSHNHYGAILALILIGAFCKSAQFPFHFWLPAAMEAPTPVSAYLHSATMVKAGIYLVARLYPALGATQPWMIAVSGVGMVTMLTGGWMALQQVDLKRILAYSTIGALGAMFFLLGIPSPLAVTAATSYLLAHALYKGALFMVAGGIDHATGTRDIQKLGGLARAMPITAGASFLAGASMAGLPPTTGFIAKELFYEATFQAPAAAFFTTTALVANGLLVAVTAIVAWQPFVGKATPDSTSAHEGNIHLWLGPFILASIGILASTVPPLGTPELISSASQDIYGGSSHVKWKLWHGWTTTLAVSAITLLMGMAVYRWRQHFVVPVATYTPWGAWTPTSVYSTAWRTVLKFARWQSSLVQSGYLRYYLIVVLSTTILLSGLALLLGVMAESTANRSNLEMGYSMQLRFYDVGLWSLIVLGVAGALVVQSRLAAIAALGVVGYGVAMLFVLFGAPDVAMTQFLVETLTVILFVLVFYSLPEAPPLPRQASHWHDLGVSVLFGGLMTILVLIATHIPHDLSLKTFYSERSVPTAHGRNIVNVILVDFRAADTLGEITVLATAATGVYALRRLQVSRGADS